MKATAAKRKSPTAPANPAIPYHRNPSADAETVDVWMHARPGSQMLNRNVDAEALMFGCIARTGSEMLNRKPGSEMPNRKVDAERCAFPQRDAI